jgi:Fe-S-cluster containining protein
MEQKSSWDEFANSIYEQFEKTGGLSLDDKVKFDPEACFPCGGVCCFAPEILLTPYDIYRLAKAGVFKKLKVNLSDFLKKFCEVYVGPHSKVPIVKLGTEEHRACPFLAPVLCKDKDGVLKQKIGGSGKPMFLCGIHNVKPFKCRLFPLGMIASSDGRSGIVFLNRDSCKGCDTSKEISVRQVLGVDVLNVDKAALAMDVTGEATKLAHAISADDRFLKFFNSLLFSILYEASYQFGEKGIEFEKLVEMQRDLMKKVPDTIKSSDFQQVLAKHGVTVTLKEEKKDEQKIVTGCRPAEKVHLGDSKNLQ